MKNTSNIYLAVDIGASSGRHILGYLENGQIQTEEVYRFSNQGVQKNGHLCWDTEYLFGEILNGLKECKRLGKIPVAMGIDTWAIDFVLIDKEGNRLTDCVCYRDKRTEGMDTVVSGLISDEELYRRTGIQKQPFNTVYQLMALKEEEPEVFQSADCFLMVPDYFHFLLTGKRSNEYTNASTTELLKVESGQWDEELLQRLGIPSRLFLEPSMPGTELGTFTAEVEREVGFSCRVVLPATHDTGSAVLAVPSEDEDFLFLSSGTWSLLGAERRKPECSEESRMANFTNEGGYEKRYRYLKNIMGLWMVQSVRKELKDVYGFGELSRMAEEASSFPSRLDVNDNMFLAPESMTEAVKIYCRKTDQPVPETVGELVSCIDQSLAASYGESVREIERITGRSYSRLQIVGGGSQDAFLNSCTARETGKEIWIGPTEATAIGNLLAQMLQDGIFDSVEEARRAVRDSFAVKKL